ncbi:MAG: biotin synthase BioB [Phycisphaeraceae bacterium]|nr:MAG: biotin synthase BioB [Phycisphaeraceae bacterium]
MSQTPAADTSARPPSPPQPPSIAGLSNRLASFVEAGLAGRSIDAAHARAVLGSPGSPQETIPLLPLLHAAGEVRRRWFGRSVRVHVLNNVQNGACPEDCGYCGQARTSKAPIQPYKLKTKEEIIAEAEGAKKSGAFRYCMVLSGRGPSDADIDHMAECIREVKRRFGLRTCLSAGLLDEAKAQRLRDAGLDRFNHNLNTSRRWYPQICTTHTYDDRVETLKAARASGVELCSGLIVGMGESLDDIADVAQSLAGLEAESIPVNFLVPIPGNEVASPSVEGGPLTPELCLRVLCLMRLVNPKAEVRVAAGREGHLRSMQALALAPANSLFVDGYLLTRGSDALATLRMIRDAGCTIELEGADWPEELRRFASGDDGGYALPDGARELDVIKPERLSERKLAKLSVNGKAAADR